MLGEIENPADVFSRAMLEVFPVYRDEAAIASLFAGARAFMDLVDSDTQPPVDYSAECRDFLNGKRLPAIVALKYEDHAALVDELAAAHAASKAAEKRLATAKNLTREALALAGANRINTDHGPVVWTANKQLRVPKGWSSEEQEHD